MAPIRMVLTEGWGGMDDADGELGRRRGGKGADAGRVVKDLLTREYGGGRCKSMSPETSHAVINWAVERGDRGTS